MTAVNCAPSRVDWRSVCSGMDWIQLRDRGPGRGWFYGTGGNRDAAAMWQRGRKRVLGAILRWFRLHGSKSDVDQPRAENLAEPSSFLIH